MSIIKRVINNLGIFVLILGGAFIYLSNTESSPANSQTTDSSTAEILMADTDLSTNQLLDVPLEDQYGGEIMMENGCEITALSMLLNYYGYETDKNELVDLLDFVPLYEMQKMRFMEIPMTVLWEISMKATRQWVSL
ncbi:C39 family peptidase [Enterococcus avium]